MSTPSPRLAVPSRPPLTARTILGLFGLIGIAQAACEPPTLPEPKEPDDPDAACIIGDPVAPAELELVIRTVDGKMAPYPEDGRVPMILPPQGGKVVLVGVRGINVSCTVQLQAGLRDFCQDPPIFVHSEPGRPARLVEVDGIAQPADPSTLQNYSNLQTCPTFASPRDGDEQPYELVIRVREQRRPGEDVDRVWEFHEEITPFCGEPEIEADCACECDADLSFDLTREEQCPTIHDNDVAWSGACPDPAP